MSHETQPEAMRLANTLTYGKAMIPEIDLPEAAAELRRLYSENEKLRNELINESKRTAEYKLRYEQINGQHTMLSKRSQEANKVSL